MIYKSQTTTLLEATGLPLGLFAETRYEAANTFMAPGDTLLLFTDGLTDSIPGDSQQESLRKAISTDLKRSLTNLRALIDPKLSADDIAILPLKRR